MPIEFGKIPLEDLQMKVYPKYSSAEAIVLCDYDDGKALKILYSDTLGLVTAAYKLTQTTT